MHLMWILIIPKNFHNIKFYFIFMFWKYLFSLKDCVMYVNGYFLVCFYWNHISLKVLCAQMINVKVYITETLIKVNTFETCRFLTTFNTKISY